MLTFIDKDTARACLAERGGYLVTSWESDGRQREVFTVGERADLVDAGFDADALDALAPTYDATNPRRAYDTYDGMHLDEWQKEVVRHPTREAAEAAADEDARALVGREVYIKTVDVLGGTHTFDAPVRVRVTNCAPHPTDDGQWNYADFYVDFAFCNQAYAEVARGAWTYGRQHAYPRAPSAHREMLPKRPDADSR
jgi:hypothetical protein